MVGVGGIKDIWVVVDTASRILLQELLSVGQSPAVCL